MGQFWADIDAGSTLRPYQRKATDQAIATLNDGTGNDLAESFAPGHQLIPAKARIAAYHNLCLWPPQANALDDPRQFLHRARCTILVRATKTGTQQVLTAKDIQRQVAVAPIAAVVKTTVLMPVERIIGRIHVQYDLFRCAVMSLQKKIDK
jgi:hypothetical protein